MIVEVSHPVRYGHLPRGGRNPRFGLGTGTTSVELRHVAERPREALRVGAERILAAEGRAWRVLRKDGENVAPATFAAYVSASPDRPSTHAGRGPRGGGDAQWAAIQAWAATSPLLHEVGGGLARSGSPGPAGARLVEGGPEEASADVRAFLDDRVRLHGDRVLVREERLVGLGDLYQARPWAAMGDDPRHRGTNRFIRTFAIVAVRPDRLAAAWDLNPRPRRGAAPSGPWDELARLPPELLGDDDLAWVANRLPGILLREIRASVARAAHGPDADPSDPAAALARLQPTLAALDRRSYAHAVHGAGVAPALETLRAAVSHVIAHRRSANGRGRGDLQGLATFEAVLRLMDHEYLPRLSGAPSPRPEAHADAEAMATLAPR